MIVGGGEAEMGDLLQPMCQVVQKRSLSSVARVVGISTAVLSSAFNKYGAVVQVLDMVLDQLTQE